MNRYEQSKAQEKEHSEKLYNSLKEYADHVFLMTGNNSKKEHKKILEQLHQVSKKEALILVATGSLIGEGLAEFNDDLKQAVKMILDINRG